MNRKMLQKAMKEMGRRGGLARARSLTARQRREQARKAGLARQNKTKGDVQ
jgi:hypothetical protein